jgi:hypothetical protein
MSNLAVFRYTYWRLDIAHRIRPNQAEEEAGKWSKKIKKGNVPCVVLRL